MHFLTGFGFALVLSAIWLMVYGDENIMKVKDLSEFRGLLNVNGVVTFVIGAIVLFAAVINW